MAKKQMPNMKTTELVAPGITYDQKNNMITAVHLKKTVRAR